MKFEKHAIAKLGNFTTALIKKHVGLAEQTQKGLLAMAASIEEHKNTDQLTRLIEGISSKSADGKVVLNAQAKQIGMYMQHMLPVSWDKESQSFKVGAKHKDFDWDAALTAMEATRWDKFKNEKADQAFDVDKEYSKLVGTVKKFMKNAKEAGVSDANTRRVAAMARVAGVEMAA